MATSSNLSYQEAEDHNKLMEAMTEVVDKATTLMEQYDPNMVSAHNESSTAHPDIRNKLSSIETQVDSIDSNIDTQIASAKTELSTSLNSQISSINSQVVGMQTTVDNVSTKVTNLQTEVKNIISGGDGSATVTLAVRAVSNENGYAIADTIVKDLSVSGNSLSYTLLDGSNQTLSIIPSVVTANSDGLMTSTDKQTLDALASNTTAITDDEINEIASTIFAN